MSKPVYGKNALQSRNVEKIPSAIWALVAAFILFLLWTPFQVGLFNGLLIDFEKPLYVSAMFGALMLLVWIGLYYKKFKLEEQRDVLAVAALLLPVTYALSLFVAVSRYMAMDMLFIQSMYAAVFIIALYLFKQKQLNVVIQNALLAIAYFIVGFGLLNWLGAWRLAGGLVGWFSNTVRNGKYLDAVMTDSNGLRLTSIFQYANTYAAFLMAFLFVAVFALIRSRKWYGTLTHGFMLVPIIVSILLTLSRGGLVLLPVVFILLLLFLKPAQQILWIAHLAIAGIASLLITNPITTLGTELNTEFTSSAAFKGWGFLLGASLIVAGLGWVVQRYAAPWLEKKLGSWESRKLTGLWIPLGSVVLIGLVAFLLVGTSARTILPANMETRLENINFKQHSVLERFTFYKDALKVVKDYPVLGAGGGGWSSLYEHYQNNPYTSRQVHNFFLQYLVEVGILGFIVFMGFILYIFYKYIRAYIKRDKDEYQNGFFYLIIALSILVHSLLDFNMSYAFMGILVFLGLAGMAAVMESKPLRKSWNKSGVRLGYLGVLAVCTVFMLFLSITYIGSSNAAVKAKSLLTVSQSYEEIKAPLMEVLKTRPNHPESAIYLSSLDQQVFSQNKDEQFLIEAESVLTRALEDEPYNKNLLKQLISNYDLKGQSDQAFAIFRDNADKFNWDIEWYEDLISRSYALGHEAFVQKDEVKQKEYFKAGLDAYNHVVAGVEHLKTLPPEQMQGRPFSITPTIALNIGKIQMISGDPEAAKATLRLGFNDNYADIINSNNLWEMDWYGTIISRFYDQAQAVYTQTLDVTLRPDYMRPSLTTGIEAYNHVLMDIEYMKTLSTEELKGRSLTITPAIALNAGKVQFLSKQLQAATTTLHSGLSEDYSDATNQEIARWYLASLIKSNTVQDEAVYNRLIAADPTATTKIDEILAMQF
ncbi:O-antigen ligase family protein [Paenibacillus wynnii]|uniref:O-antigen ligase family protein n=1 Tax=Paenibacillus wynnii TaxID=268407 RepID=UPI0027923984|nr:O-antigen ligase family protein [Paenibacillus wynnii]MDQ0192100.1 tetratricopeptide (TPR) repeat protein/MFS family permease [Paenibacillus wynnii]